VERSILVHHLSIQTHLLVQVLRFHQIQQRTFYLFVLDLRIEIVSTSGPAPPTPYNTPAVGNHDYHTSGGHGQGIGIMGYFSRDFPKPVQIV